MPAPVTTFDTVPFERSHGRKPSRTALGSWGFCPADRWRAADYLDHVFWAPRLSTLREAQAAARAHFPAGAALVVCP